MVYVCENNGYGELSAARLVVSVPDISARAAGYGIPGVTVDGQDAVAVYEAVARARRGEGPSLVETKTCRFHDHAFGPPERAYRDQTNGASVAALWVGGAFAISATAVAGHHIRINAGGDLAIIDHPTGAAVLWGAAQDLFFTLLSVFLRWPA